LVWDWYEIWRKVVWFVTGFVAFCNRGLLKDLENGGADFPMFHHKLLDGKTWAKVWKMWPSCGEKRVVEKWYGGASMIARSGRLSLDPWFGGGTIPFGNQSMSQKRRVRGASEDVPLSKTFGQERSNSGRLVVAKRFLHGL
jgi:hypothetical protein